MMNTFSALHNNKMYATKLSENSGHHFDFLPQGLEGEMEGAKTKRLKYLYGTFVGVGCVCIKKISFSLV